MQQQFAFKLTSSIRIITFLVGLFLYSTRETKVQGSHREFLELLRPYVNKDIKVSLHGSELTDPVLLKEVATIKYCWSRLRTLHKRFQSTQFAAYPLTK